VLRSTVALAATGAAVYGAVAATTANAEGGGTHTGTALTGSAADAITATGKTRTVKTRTVKTGTVKTRTVRTTAKTASAKPKPASKPKVTSISCASASGPLPANVSAIVTFLVHHGYSDNAAAGIAGNIYQESKGNPEAVGTGGGGLIGFTPLPGGYETGNVGADLRTQLKAVLSFNQQWSSYLPELNAASSPAAAAQVYVDDFERAGIPAASTRKASAEAVASACDL
jgi:hypothetical protein